MICNIFLLIHELALTVGIEVWFPVRQHHHWLQLGSAFTQGIYSQWPFLWPLDERYFHLGKKLFIQERMQFIYWATLWVLTTYLDFCKGNLGFLSILQSFVKVQDHPCFQYHVSNFLKGLQLKQAADGTDKDSPDEIC